MPLPISIEQLSKIGTLSILSPSRLLAFKGRGLSFNQAVMYRHTMLVATVVVCMQFTLAATGVTSVAGVRAAQATLTREKGGCSRANRSLQVEEAKAALPTHAFPDAGMDGPDGANVRIHRTSAVAVFRPSPLRSSPRPLCMRKPYLSLTLLLLSTTADSHTP